MSTAVVLFTRDLRVHDNPTLHAAATSADRVLPLFVVDEAITGSEFSAPNRAAFLAGSLRTLDRSLKRLGGIGLVVRHGDVVKETARLAETVGAAEVHVSQDWSGYAQRRQERLAAALGDRLRLHPETLAVVPPGSLRPNGRNHFAVFTPFYVHWDLAGRRDLLDPPTQVRSPEVRKGRLPKAEEICPGPTAPYLPEPGEAAARQRLEAWLADGVRDYADLNDALADDATSRLSPYLHFGCLSPLEAAVWAGRSEGGEAFRRQLAWRDFHLQVLAARPDAAHRDYRHRGDRWQRSVTDLNAWREGRTGYPIVDAGMRQLLSEGWMHNRARLITASFFTKHLYLDWRLGAAHFLHHLVDGDISNNQMNWQWVAGTGTDNRPDRVFNPLRQAERYDPDGDYVRRYVPELAGIPGHDVHRPWELPDEQRWSLDYPSPLVDLDEARTRFLAARGKN